MSAARLRTIVVFAGGMLAFLYCLYGRDYPVRLALMVGAAVMFLGFAAIRTWERMRQM